MFAKGIEGVTGRKLSQNYIDGGIGGGSPKQAVDTIKTNIKAAAPDSTTAQAVDSIKIDFEE
jgi:hypothetical protein